MKAIELLAKFIEDHKGERSGHRCINEWLCRDDMEVYVSRSVQRILNDGQRCVCLDIGNVTVYDKGKGHFTAFLRQAHEMNPLGSDLR